MSECTGEEKHYHYVMGTDELVWHSHPHSVMEKDFNRLHHHPPIEHKSVPLEVLNKDTVRTKVPF